MHQDPRVDLTERVLKHQLERYKAKLCQYIEDEPRKKLHQAIEDISDQIKIMNGEKENGIGVKF